MITGERPPWLVRIQRATPETARRPASWGLQGAGLLATHDHVVTCAHVVDPDLPDDAPTDALRVEFEFAGPRSVGATIVEWLPAPDKDVAVLRLDGSLPAEARPAPLGSDEGAMSGHGFLAFGYPAGFAEQAVPSSGTITAAGHKLALTVGAQAGFVLERGFSGSPVWDHALQAVVGIVVERVGPRDEYKSLGPRDTGVGFAISIRQIAQWWPPLAEHVRRPTDEERRDRLAGLTTLPLDGEELPRVRDVDPYDIGVARSTHSGPGASLPPYARRPVIDGQLEEALRTASFVLAVGPSAAGKSRSMAHALSQVVGDARIAVPTAEPESVSRLARLSLSTDDHGTILWLDDLHQYLGAKGLDLKVLDDLQRRRPPVRIAATMTSQRYADRQKVEGTVGVTMRNVLARATVVRIERDLSDEGEVAAAREAYPDFTVEDLRTRGIGALLVAARELDELYRDSRELDLPAWAVLQATIDWRRIGLETPIPEPALRALFVDYLDDAGRPGADHDALFGPALERVLSPVAGTVAAVTRSEHDGVVGYRAYDYLKELADNPREGIPARTVPAIVQQRALEHGTPRQVLDMAFAAMVARRLGEAVELLERAHAQQTDPYVVAWAALLLGEIHANAPASDQELAERLLREAVASGYADVVSLGQVDLGAALLDKRQLPEAARLLEAALTADDPGVRMLAKANLGTVRMQEGDFAAAEQLLGAVIAGEESETTDIARGRLGQMYMGAAGQRSSAGPERVRLDRVRPTSGARVLAVQLAQTNMAALLMQGGEPVKARTLLEAAVRSEDPRVRPLAQASLGWLELAEGNRDRGVDLLRAAIESVNPRARNYALVRRALLAQEHGDTGAAAVDFRTVAESGDVEYGPWAFDLLGDLLAGENDLVGAEAAYRSAIATEHDNWSQQAMIDLAQLLAGLNDHQADLEALHLLGSVSEGSHPVHRIFASGVTGELLGARGDIDGAADAYQRVIESERSDWSLQATIQLAELLKESEEPQHRARAEVLLREVARRGDTESLWAQDSLGDLLLKDGDVEGAREAYQQVIDSEHHRWARIARIDLAVLLADALEDLDGAAEQLEIATEAQQADVAASAHLTLGLVRRAQGRKDEARTEFASATGTASAEVDVRARYALAKLAAGDADLTEAAAQLRAFLAAVGSPSGVPVDVDGGPALVLQCDYLLDIAETDTAEEILSDALSGVRQAGGSVDSDVVTALLAVLGRATFLQKDYPRARELLEEALGKITAGTRGEPPVEWLVRRYLAATLAQLEETAGVHDLLRPLVLSDDTEHRAAALHLLGMLDRLEGNEEGAAAQFAAARDLALVTDDADTAEEADSELMELTAARMIAPPSPRPALPRAERATPGLSPLIRVLLGELAAAQGDRVEADYWTGSALALGLEPELRARAQLVAATVAFEAGDTETAAQLAQQVVEADVRWTGRAARLLEEITR